MTARLTLVRGTPPNVSSRGLPGPSSDDPAARRRELRVVLELCAARARGAREREAPNRVLTLLCASKTGAGTTLGAVRQRRETTPAL